MKIMHIVLSIVIVCCCERIFSLENFESEVFESVESPTNLSPNVKQNLDAATNVCDLSTSSLLEEKIQDLQQIIRQTDDQYSIVVKELEMARQIIGELNIKLATRDSELASLKQSPVFSSIFNQKNITIANMNIEELLIASIEESTQYIKELNRKLEDVTTTASQCQEEKSALTKEIAVFDVKSRIAKNEQNLARLSRDQCLLEIELIKAERDANISSACPYQFYSSNESKSCDIISCLRSVSIRDLQTAISKAYKDNVTNGLLPFLARKRQYTMEFLTIQLISFQESGYPYICRCIQFSWQNTCIYVVNTFSVCRYAWTSHFYPFFTNSIQPKMVSFYSKNIDPFVTERIIPFYKLHIEESIDALMQFISDFYFNYLEGIVTEYLEPAFEWTVAKIHYVVYFTIKYFEQDDWLDVSIIYAQNVVHTILENLAGLFVVQSVCGVTHSGQCAAAIATIILLIVAWFLRTLLLGVAAGVLFLLLSPLLAVLYVLSKLVLFLLPPTSSKLTPANSDKMINMRPVSTSNHRESGHSKPKSVAVRRDDSQAELRRSHDSVLSSSSHGSSQHITRRSASPSQRKMSPLPPLPPQSSRTHPYSLSFPQSPARLDVSHDSTAASYPYFIPSNNMTNSANNSPYSKQTSRSTSYDNDNIIYTATPSKARKLEQLRQRKSPGAVTLGLTPAAALGLVPIGMERSRSRSMEDDEVEDEEELVLYNGREHEEEVGETGEGLEGEEADDLGNRLYGEQSFDEKDAAKDFSYADL
mmetsp:Transcript_23067/g.33098  ORF Transcript_23067/g.33098 Transcript_23067/m.33098 type:complete len:761 (-) Transcript_23067:63-2345(-)